MKDLIARLEAAREGGSGLSDDVHVHLHGESVSLCDRPDYTTSVDAALTLVPEGWFWVTGSATFMPPRSEPWAQVYRGNYVEHTAKAATPALALTIAALKARRGET